MHCIFVGFSYIRLHPDQMKSLENMEKISFLALSKM